MKAQSIVSLNPGRHYVKIGHVPITQRTEIDDKIAQARAAHPAWDSLGVKGRVEHLEKLYKAFEKHKHAIGSIATQEMGMPASVRNLIDIDAGLHYMRGYLDNAESWLAPQVVYEDAAEIHHLFFEPKGVVGASIPWNYPFCNFIWAVMQNLIVGNTIVFKHSEECPLTGKLLEELIEQAQLDTVAHEIYGDGSDVGEYLMNSAIDLIFFTGSTAVGKHLYQVAARKLIPATLELGGSAPGIIFDDADLETTIKSVYFNRFINSGQACDALKRLIVDKRIFNDVAERLAKLLATKKVGDPEDPETDLGPLVSERQLIRLEQQVGDALTKGATVITGAKRPSALDGAYYEPTILTAITRDMKVWSDEIFGPVLPIVPFQDEEEAITLANDTPYGLGGYVYTGSNERAIRVCSRLKTGNICVNDAHYINAEDPFGGYKNSGIGREHGWLGLRELCSAKLVALKKY